MNAYEYKQERRKERLEARAERLTALANGKIEAGMSDLRSIPFGQPIMVGHHSEKRDRNFRRKAGARIDKGMELAKVAREVAGRAASVGTGGISSDDPDAIKKLREELALLEARQARMVATNKLCRKGDRVGLAAMGFGEKMIEALMTPQWGPGRGPVGFADFETKNNGANIRRIKARIADLEKMSQRETKEETRQDGVRVVENAEANRLQIFFPGKPSEQARSVLKGRGFRWAPSEGAWQRQLNSGARWAAEAALKEIQP